MAANLDLHRFERIVFFSGAGLSAESGIPTYRGAGGMWNFYDYEEIACQRAFERNPEKVWDFHEKLREMGAACQPNDAHRIIARIQKTKPQTQIVTQNIDGLLQRAGGANIIELHGSIWRLRRPDGTTVENHDVPLQSRKTPDGKYWRPDIIWFEDALNADVLGRAVRAMEQCECLLSIGTSGMVYPAADLPRLAKRNGAIRIEINPEPTAISEFFQFHLRAPATQAMRELWPNS